jgi:hypothetical protein
MLNHCCYHEGWYVRDLLVCIVPPFLTAFQWNRGKKNLKRKGNSDPDGHGWEMGYMPVRDGESMMGEQRERNYASDS